MFSAAAPAFPAASGDAPASSVEFSSGVSFDGTTYTGTAGPDSIGFVNSVTEGIQVVMGGGPDSVSFGGSSKIGAGTVVDLGLDVSGDSLVIANQDLIKGSGLRVLNFQDGRDSITVAGTTYNTRAEAEAAINAIQPGSISFGA